MGAESKFENNFISLSKASKISGYHQDYLGFLARTGKLEAQKIGRNWVTTRDAINNVMKQGNGRTEISDEHGNKIRVHVEQQDQNDIINSRQIKNTGLDEQVSIADSQFPLEHKLALLKSSVLTGIAKQVAKQTVEKHFEDQQKQISNLSQVKSLAEHIDEARRNEDLQNKFQTKLSDFESSFRLELQNLIQQKISTLQQTSPEGKNELAQSDANVAKEKDRKLAPTLALFPFGTSASAQNQFSGLSKGLKTPALNLQKIYDSFRYRFNAFRYAVVGAVVLVLLVAASLWYNFDFINRKIAQLPKSQTIIVQQTGGNSSQGGNNGNNTVGSLPPGSVVNKTVYIQGKPGPQGPQGPAGPAGAQGVQGSQGLPGSTYTYGGGGNGGGGTIGAFTELSAVDLNVSNNTNLNNLTASGNVLLNGPTNISNSLTVGGPTTFNGNVTFNGTISGGQFSLISTSQPQLTVGYDTSNQWSTATNATGITTFTFKGTNPSAIFLPQTDSATAFEFTNAAGVPVLSIDTTTGTVNATSLGLTNALSVPNGGTGANTLAQYGILYGNNAAPVGVTPIGTPGQCLESNGGVSAPSWGACIAANASSWSSITNPLGNLSLAMQSFTTNFTYGNATGANVDLFTLGDTASNTGTGFLLNLTTATGSALKPLKVIAAGTTALTIDSTGLLTANNFASSSVAITGGSESGVAITTGSINNTPIGVTTPNAGNFTSIGATTPGSGAFTTLSAQGITNTGTLSVLSTTSPQLTVGYDSSNNWTSSTTSAGVTTLTFNGASSSALFKPQNNSITAFNFTKADGVSSILDIDTTNGRVGIGTATPGANTTLDIEVNQNAVTNFQVGNLTDGTAAVTRGQVNSVNGGAVLFAASPSYTGITEFAGKSGLYSTVNDGIGGNLVIASRAVTKGIDFYTGGSASANRHMVLDSNGNLGIGATSPSGKLTIAGNSSAAAWGVNGIALQGSAATYTDTSSSGTVANAVANSLGIPTFAASSATTYTSASTLYVAGPPTAGSNVTITNPASLVVATGNVGIGTASPGNLLEISKSTIGQLTLLRLTNTHGSANDTADIDFSVSGSNIITGRIGLTKTNRVAVGDSDLTFSTLSNNVLGEKMRIMDNGNVGIGVTSPSGKLTVAGNKSATAWGLNGIALQAAAATYTDTSSSGTVTNAVANSFGQPTFAASSATTYTNAATLYIAGPPVASTNVTLTNAFALNVSSGSIVIGNNYGYQARLNTGVVANMMKYDSSNNAIIGPNNEIKLNGDFTAQPPGRVFITSAAGNGGNFNLVGGMADGATAVGILMNTTNVFSTTGSKLLSIQNHGTEKANIGYNGSAYFAGNVGIGVVSPTAQLNIGGNQSAAAWGLNGIALQGSAATYTDTSSSGTVTNNAVSSFAQPTLAASNAATYTNASTLYIANAPAAGTNVSITNPYALNVAAGNSFFGGSVTAAGITNTGTLSVLTTTTPQLTVGYDSSNNWTSATTSAGATTFTFNGASSSALFEPQNNSTSAFNFTKADGTTSVLNVDTTNGRVGIGTNVPTYPLSVTGFVYSTTGYYGTSFTNPNSNYAGYYAGTNGAFVTRNIADTNPAFYINQVNTSSTGDLLDLQSAGTTKVAFLQNGRVGIGTTSPTQTLDIGPSGASTGNTGVVKVRELAANGTFGVGFKAPDLLLTSNAADLIWTLPAVDGTIGQVLQTNGSGILSWTANSASGMANPMTTIGDLIYASTTAAPSTPSRLAIGTTGQCLVVSGGLPSWGACSGTAAAAGSNTQVQFNSSGSFGADAGFTWDNTNKTLGISTATIGAYIPLALRDTNNGNATTTELRMGNDTAANALSLMVNSSTLTDANTVSITNKNTTGALSFGTNSTERMRILANGNVGIGTTIPSGKLTIAGDSSAAAWGVNGIVLQGSAATYTDTSSSGTVTNAVANSLGIPTFAASSATTYTNASTLYVAGPPTAGTNVTITNPAALVVATGNVGIGTSSPAQKLDINGGSARITFGGSAVSDANLGGLLISTNGTSNSFHALRIVTNVGGGGGNKEAFTVTNANNVGIGTTTPSGKLTITGAASATAWGTNGIALQGAAATYTDTSSSGTVANAVANSLGIPTFAASSATTYTSASTLYVAGPPTAGTNVTITNPASLIVATGNVGIGTTSPSGKLNVDATSGNILNLSNNGTSELTVDNLGNAAGTSFSSGANIGLKSGSLTMGSGSIFRWSSSTSWLGAVDTGLSRLGVSAMAVGNGTAGDYTGTLIAGNVGIGTSTPSGQLTLAGNRSATAWGVNGIALQGSAATYTDTSSSGTVTNAVANSLGIPTFAASSATTYTSASTLYVAGPPTAGTNVTITNPAALVVATGNVGIGTTSPGTPLELVTALGAGGLRVTRSGTATQYLSMNESAAADHVIQAAGTKRLSFINDLATASGIQFEFDTNAATPGGGNRALVITTEGNVGIGATSPSGKLTLAGNSSASAWGLNGIALQGAAATYTDTSSSGTVTNNAINSFAQPTLAASSATTYTNAATLYIANAPAAGSNVSITNPYALNVAAGTSLFGGNLNLTANFLQTGSGTFGTGTGAISLNGATSVTGTNTFTVGTGLVTIGGNETNTNGWLCVGNGGSTCSTNPTVAGTIYAVSLSISAADYAESYLSTDLTMQPGMLVDADINNAGQMIASTNLPYDSNITGVISTSPGTVIGNADTANPPAGTKAYPIALTGRVPVLVTDENGPIKIGDYLTSSAAMPGYAMKAIHSGKVIGQALNNFDGTGGQTQNINGLIIHTISLSSFVHVAYEDINNTYVIGDEDLTLAQQSLKQGDGGTQQLGASDRSLTYIIRQNNNSQTLADILQLQSGDITRFMVASSGATTINAQVSDDTQNIFVVSNNGSDQFVINAKGNLIASGSIVVKKDISALGTVLGSTSILAKNTDASDIKQGDLVMFKGVEDQSAVGNNPVLTVVKASGDSTTQNLLIVGIADRNLSDFDIPGSPSSSTNDITDIPAGEYMNVVTSGTFTTINVDASNSAIAIGDKLTVSTNAGFARKYDSAVDSGMPVIGIALDALSSGTGKTRIWLTLNNGLTTAAVGSGNNGGLGVTGQPGGAIGSGSGTIDSGTGSSGTTGTTGTGSTGGDGTGSSGTTGAGDGTGSGSGTDTSGTTGSSSGTTDSGTGSSGTTDSGSTGSGGGI